MSSPYRGTHDAEAAIAEAKLADEARKRWESLTPLEQARRTYFQLGMCGVPRDEAQRERLDKMHREARDRYYAELEKDALARKRG